MKHVYPLNDRINLEIVDFIDFIADSPDKPEKVSAATPSSNKDNKDSENNDNILFSSDTISTVELTFSQHVNNVKKLHVRCKNATVMFDLLNATFKALYTYQNNIDLFEMGLSSDGGFVVHPKHVWILQYIEKANVQITEVIFRNPLYEGTFIMIMIDCIIFHFRFFAYNVFFTLLFQ